MLIEDYPNYPFPGDNDLLLIWDTANQVTQQVTKKQLLSGVSSGGSGAKPWVLVTAGSTSLSTGDRLIVDTSQGDVTLSLPSSSFGVEVELIRLDAANKLILNGLTLLRGRTIVTGAIATVSKTDTSSIRLVYTGDVQGWVDFPSGSVRAFSPLNLPQTGLIQLFYANNISGVANGELVDLWADTQSNKNASQSNSTNQPTYVTNIFGNLPSLKFNGNQFFSTDFTYLADNYYTLCLVEQRTSSSSNSYACGHTTSGTNTSLHFGYRTDTSFTLAQWDNDLDYSSVLAYSSPISRIWLGSLSSRGHEIWLNNSLVASNTNTTYLISNTSGVIGRSAGGYFNGHIGLLANYTGDKSQQEIKDIFTSINNTFNIY